MSGLVIEFGVYFLLLFTPLAFGGVEMWAIGVVQIVAGIVFTAWAVGEGAKRGLLGARRRDSSDEGEPSRLRAMWIAFGLFVLLAAIQMIPLPPAAIRAIAPGVHELYTKTLPGYAEGKGFDSAEVPAWLLAQAGDRIPETLRQAPPLPEPEPSAAASAYPGRAPSWRTLSIHPFQTRQNLTLLLCYAGVFIATTGHFRTKERLARLVGATVVAAFAVSVFGIVQKLDWNGKLYWVREGEFGNPFGPFVNRNSYAAFAGTALPVALCLALGALRRLREGYREEAPRLFFFSFASVAIAGGIFYSLSRGGMIAAGLSVVVVAALLLYFRRSVLELSLLAILLAAAAAFLVWIGPEKVVERAESIPGAGSTPSLALRVVAWERSLQMVRDNPIVGSGLGSFRFAFLRYAPPGQAWWTTAHNEYVEILCDTGIAGAAIVVVGFGAWALRVLRPRRFRGRSGRYIFAGLVAGIAGLLLHSAVSSNLQVPANGILLVVAGAALQGVVAHQGGKHQRRRASPAETEGGTP